MKLDRLGQRAAADVRENTPAAAPSTLEEIARVARRRDRLARSAMVAGAMTVIAVAVGLSSLVEPDELEPRLSDPVATTVATTTPPPTTAPPVTLPDGLAVVPGVDAATAATIEEPPHPGATLLTEETLTPELIESIRAAVDGLDERSQPLQVHAAFEKDGVIHTVVEYSSDRTALMVVENGEATRFLRGEGGWINVHGIRKSPTDWWAFTQITWLGLPDNAATARLTTPQRPDDIVDQVVIGGTAFFEIGKPDWTQIGTLILFDEEGEVIMTDETRLHGTSCSSRLQGPPTPDFAIPEAIETGRIALAEAAYTCRAATVAGLAIGHGPYFDLSMESLAARLRDLDQRTGAFGSMAAALKIRPREVVGSDGTSTYVFEWSGGPGLDQGPATRVELGFSEDGVWQYGLLEDL